MALNIKALDVNGLGKCQYDLVIAGLGYERRARHFVESILPSGNSKIALGFDRQQVLSYEQNRKKMEELGYTCLSVSSTQFFETARTIIEEASISSSNRSLTRVSVDITSLTRRRIAYLVELLAEQGKKKPIEAHFVYSLAKYSAPGREPELITTSEPVSDYFAGWSSHPERPLAVLVGLGYELEKAIGVLEYLEPGWTWVFFPTGTDRRYEIAVDKANRTLLKELGRNPRIDYLVPRPLDCLTMLNSLVSKCSEFARPVIVPLGPKIFALNAMLVSLAHRPGVSVWRVSAGTYEEPKERKPTGELIGMSVSFELTGDSVLSKK